MGPSGSVAEANGFGIEGAVSGSMKLMMKSSGNSATARPGGDAVAAAAVTEEPTGVDSDAFSRRDDSSAPKSMYRDRCASLRSDAYMSTAMTSYRGCGLACALILVLR